MLRKWFSFGEKLTLNKEQSIEFRSNITFINLQRLKILGIIGVILQTIYNVLLLLGVLLHDDAGIIGALLLLFIAIVGLFFLSIVQKKQSPFWNVALVNAITICLLILSVGITFLRFQNNQPDILFYLEVLFILNIIVIKKPLMAAIQIFGSAFLLVLLITLNKPELLDYSIILNGFGFTFIAYFSATIIYNNQVKIFLEKQQAKEANEKLEIIAQTDQLTGLNNRRKINEVLARQVREHNVSHIPFSVVMFDIDYFKRINDQYGHVRGDEILYEIGSVLKENLRTYDVAGRWGGDEFIMICCHTHPDEAVKISKRIQQKICAHDFGNGLAIRISMGISEMAQDATIEQVILWADMALLKAKENGRNCIEVSKHISDENRANS